MGYTPGFGVPPVPLPPNPGLPGFQVAATFTTCDPQKVQAGHGGNIQVGLADGSVKGVGAGASPLSWYGAAIPNDNTLPASDW
jgi:hypothetical protein